MMDGSAHMIDCNSARKKLWEYFDGELSSESAGVIRAHLEACSHCSQVANLSRRFLAALAALAPNESVPAELRGRVVEALRSDGLHLR